MALAVNALVMSTLSGVFGRYQARLEFLLFLPAAASFWRAVRRKSRVPGRSDPGPLP